MVSAIVQAWKSSDGVDHLINLAHETDLVDEVLIFTEGSFREARIDARWDRARLISRRFRGTGAAVEDGLRESSGDVLVLLTDHTLAGGQNAVERLVHPILAGTADFVIRHTTSTAARFHSVAAESLLAKCFPELDKFSGPFSGSFAVRRNLLERLSLEFDWGALVGLLVDAQFAGARMKEVAIEELGQPSWEHQSSDVEAEQVMRVILNRAEHYGRLSIGYTQEIDQVEANAKAGWATALSRIEGAGRVALFDMDGTLLRDRSVLDLARRTGRLQRVMKYLDNAACTADERCELIADCFAGVARSEFAETARSMLLSEGAMETVLALRRNGYRVGIVSDGYQIVTDIVRRRIAADFSIGTLMHFRNGKATGQITHSPMFRHKRGCRQHRHCKVNALHHLHERLAIRSTHVLAVGDGTNDACLLRDAGLGVAYEPKADSVREAAAYVIHGDLSQLLGYCPAPVQTGLVEWNGLSAISSQ